MSGDDPKWRLELPSLSPEIQRRGSTSTLAKAALAMRARPGTLRTLLQAEGKLRDEKRKGSPVRISQEDVGRLARDYASSLTFSGLASFLGVGRRIVEILRETNELPVWVSGGKHGLKHRYVYRRSDVENWIHQLIGDVPLYSTVPDGCLLLADTPNRKHFPIESLVKAIRNGRVVVLGRLRDRPSFGGAILSGTDVDAEVPTKIREKMGTQRRGPRGPYRKRVERDDASRF